MRSDSVEKGTMENVEVTCGYWLTASAGKKVTYGLCALTLFAMAVLYFTAGTRDTIYCAFQQCVVNQTMGFVSWRVKVEQVCRIRRMC